MRRTGRVMDHMRALGLLDSNGKPLGERIERVLIGLRPRLRRQFPGLQDDVALIDVMEEAGRRIATREERNGPIEHLHGYAWVTVRSVATSYLRRPSSRLIQNTLESEASNALIASAPAAYGSPEQIERDILLREALDTLSQEERMVCLWKKAGFSAQEIAKFQGRSVVAVDTLFSRAKQKIRSVLGLAPGTGDTRLQSKGVNGRTYEPAAARDEATETPDGTLTSGLGNR